MDCRVHKTARQCHGPVYPRDYHFCEYLPCLKLYATDYWYFKAPLSLMAALFSLRVVEFPANLHLNYVLKYMFVVSIAIIAPLIGLVIYTTRGTITHLVLRLETQLLKSKRKDGLSGKHWIAKQQDHDGDTSSSTTEATSRNVGGLRRRLVFWKKRNKGGAEDTEKAAATDTSGDLG